jgi:hypothetical protein
VSSNNNVCKFNAHSPPSRAEPHLAFHLRKE